MNGSIYMLKCHFQIHLSGKQGFQNPTNFTFRSLKSTRTGEYSLISTPVRLGSTFHLNFGTMHIRHFKTEKSPMKALH